MTASLRLVGIDLGAESGRLMLGTLDEGRLHLQELHRFASLPVRLPGGLFTDVAHIWREIGVGLRAASAACSGEIHGVGVDTWGVDFALLDADGGLLGLPYHYRDDLCEGMLAKACDAVSAAGIYAATGIQFLPINTLYQLMGLREKRPSLLDAARTLLMMPDLFTHWLGGDACSERTIASTSQCYDPVRRDWAFELLDRLGIPRRLFPAIREPASVAGQLLPGVAGAAGLRPAPVLSPGGHDTALAVAAVPARSADYAYISSGTWSLFGAELTAPILGEAALEASFTNEVGVCGTVRFLKNICGLWLVQESRRAFAEAGRDYSHADLAALAAQAPAWSAVIDVDAPAFSRPGDMPAKIAAACRETGQAVPDGPGAIVRVALEGLALKYRHTLRALERLTGRPVGTLHIVGGGSLNRLLCQLAADATGCAVVAGPVEATAVGNLLMQAVALGHLGSLADVREVVRRSFDVTTYEPRPAPALDEAYGRLQDLLNQPPAQGRA